MKPSRFRYAKPASLDETFDLLARYGDDAMVLAGGQSLLAGLGMRLAAPEMLVDINGLEGMSGISQQGDEIVIGALTRHAEVLASPIVAQHLPLVAEAITHVGHMGIRNRGTFGGSLAYADPAAELPACSVAQKATLLLAGSAGRRKVTAEAFFTGILETALKPGELILEIRLPVQQPAQKHVFAELSRRHGDFALAGLAGLVTLEGGRLAEARLVYFGCVTHAEVARNTSTSLAGQPLPLPSADALEELLRQDLSPSDSPGMRANTKLQLAAVITRRALNALQGTSTS
ncbi:MAG: aerobic-type carbon monoxide dehydrogenase, middle subunit CoxM/CutM-like protein [Reyranella sp.]|nr:aerobic-type carbon monoxide dehydrogenase, middle subunit CoxM/CutM-like protein [Reyranella sp.]